MSQETSIPPPNQTTHKVSKSITQICPIPTLPAQLTLNSKAGMGVKRSMWIMDRRSGRWPSRDPTKNNLDEAKIDALRPPKQDRATAMGMVQLNMPNVWSANVTATASLPRTSEMLSTV